MSISLVTVNSFKGWLRYLRLRAKNPDGRRALIRHWVEPPLLDVGCGNGWLLEEVEGWPVGIDNERRKKSPEMSGLHRADITDDWDFLPDQEFETVSMIQVIEHFNCDEAAHLLREAYRVLKPGGRLIIDTPMPSSVWRTFFHVRPYPPSAIRQWVTRDHHPPVPYFRIEDVWYWGTSRAKYVRPIKHLMANLGVSKRVVYTMLLRKEE